MENFARARYAPRVIFDHLTEIPDPDPHAAALNMALDEILLRGAATPLLRVYRWARPALSFGYFGNYRDIAARWPGRDIVRRWTGGGEVPHGADFTYTLIVPRAHSFSRRSAPDSYRAIHECLAQLLAASTVAENAAPKTSGACFENAARFDVLIDSQKIAGAAQRRTAHGLLHQGSIQLDNLAPDFAARFAATLSAQRTRRPISPAERAAAHELAQDKYATDAWLRRFGAD